LVVSTRLLGRLNTVSTPPYTAGHVQLPGTCITHSSTGM
jgi:hypothetical protein